MATSKVYRTVFKTIYSSLRRDARLQSPETVMAIVKRRLDFMLSDNLEVVPILSAAVEAYKWQQGWCTAGFMQLPKYERKLRSLTEQAHFRSQQSKQHKRSVEYHYWQTFGSHCWL